MISRINQFATLFPRVPAYRLRQINDALFTDISGWQDATNLPVDMREVLVLSVPWNTWKVVSIVSSLDGYTHKALVEAADCARSETVLMKNARGHWTVCVSCQVGCPMGCVFCATGKMGFIRNLSADEIVDQVRLWKDFLRESQKITFSDEKGVMSVGRAERLRHFTTPIGTMGESTTLFSCSASKSFITNVVFMGMGEPMANYEAVRTAAKTLVEKMGIGPTRITISSAGILPMLERLTDDPLWPPVRIAISLHSAIESTRKNIMPSSYDGFLDRLVFWARRHQQAHPSRKNYLTLEYILLFGINDTDEHMRALGRFGNRISDVRINLIPYNTTGKDYQPGTEEQINRCVQILQKYHLAVTVRRSRGQDITAACGQLYVQKGRE